MTLAEGIDKLAAQPLMSQPGAAWNYSLSTDVLGRVVEVASGQPFDVFLRERIFKPLGMIDTDFVVTDAKWSRLATVYSPDTTGGIRPMKDPESFGNTHMSPVAYYKPGKKYFSGGAGLTSTIRDYSRFALMLAGGGAVDGVRLLSPKSVELMSADPHRRSDDARPAARPWRRLRPRVQRRDGPCRHAGARLGGHVRVERHLRHQLLGRSEGTARRDRDGPAATRMRPSPRRSSRSSTRHSRNSWWVRELVSWRVNLHSPTLYLSNSPTNYFCNWSPA